MLKIDLGVDFLNINIGPNEAGQRLDKFLRKLLKDVSLSEICKALRKGDIRVDGKKQKEKYVLNEGEVVEIRYIQSKREVKHNFQNVDASGMKITYEDNNILIAEKCPGMLVHPDSKDGEPTLTDYVLSYLYEKGEYVPENEVTFTPASCNRLDKNTSGIVIFGKNFEALRNLNEMIREDKIEKYYYTIVQGRVKDGLLTAYIVKNPEKNISKIYDEKVPNSKEIKMKVKTVETNGAYSFLEIHLITGRSHQIRAHLAHIGNPIIGDVKYGKKEINVAFRNKFGLDFQFLYAYKLIFRETSGNLEYLKNKTIAQALPPLLKKIKQDVFKVTI